MRKAASILSWPSAKMSASTVKQSPTAALARNRPQLTSGETFSMTTRSAASLASSGSGTEGAGGADVGASPRVAPAFKFAAAFGSDCFSLARARVRVFRIGHRLGMGKRTRRRRAGRWPRPRRAGLGERREEALAPPADILFDDVRPQGPMPGAALAEGHFERPPDRVGDVLRIVRVDEERLFELFGGAGELRQDQHARVVRILRGDIFLGDEVHAVAKRRHQPDPAAAEKPGKDGPCHGAVEIADRRPGQVAEAAVDMAGEALKLAADHVVG